MNRIIHFTLILAVMTGAIGCTSTQQRGGITALGAAAGGAGAYMMARGKSSGAAAAYTAAEAERREYGSGRTSYYTLPVQDDTGGVSRVPHTVTVPVVE